MKYEIYQIKDLENCPYSFRGWRTAQFKYNPEDYEKVFEGNVGIDEEGESGIIDALERLYYVFNVAHPTGYQGRSLSVSDVVKLGDDYYYVDIVGFRKIPMDVA